jgi:hypothetical protein
MAAWTISATPARTTNTAAAAWADWGTTWDDDNHEEDEEAEYDETAVPQGMLRDDESDDEVVDDE